MKTHFVIALLMMVCFSCSKEPFDLENPDVKEFVKQLKNGSYSIYEKGEDGENLWLKMPNFDEKHIQALIDYSRDTTHIAHFPINPISSRLPFPHGRDYFILGEGLLWIVEGIRNGNVYGSLDPFLIDSSQSEELMGLNGNEILLIGELYNDWWKTFKTSNWQEVNPLSDTSYRWF